MKKYKVPVRMKAQVTNSRKRRKILLFVTVLIGLLAGGGFFTNRISKFLLTSPVFNVKLIKVTGNEIIDESVVSDYLNLKGKNTFSLNPKKSEIQLMERFPVIKDVSIAKRIPSSLIVRVTERVPLAESRINANRVGTDEKLKSFAISAGFRKLPELPDSISIENKAACVMFLKSICDLPIYRNICNITAGSPNDIVLFFKGDKKVLIGSPENSELKMAYLEQIISDLEAKGKNFDYINMKDFSVNYKEATVKLK